MSLGLDTHCNALVLKAKAYALVLKAMALTVQRKIAHDLQATEFSTVMMDECTDVANQEQVSDNLYLRNLLNSYNNTSLLCIQ